MAVAWTAAKERRAIIAHVAACRFCAALLSHGRRRQDRELLAAPDSLAFDHAADEEERIALSGRRR
jgi:hypothetical protein